MDSPGLVFEVARVDQPLSHGQEFQLLPIHRAGIREVVELLRGSPGVDGPINRQALQDPAGDSVGELRTVIGAGQKGLEDIPAAGWIAAGEPRDTDMKAGGEPHDGKVDQDADAVVP